MRWWPIAWGISFPLSQLVFWWWCFFCMTFTTVNGVISWNIYNPNKPSWSFDEKTLILWPWCNIIQYRKWWSHCRTNRNLQSPKHALRNWKLIPDQRAHVTGNVRSPGYDATDRSTPIHHKLTSGQAKWPSPVSNCTMSSPHFNTWTDKTNIGQYNIWSWSWSHGHKYSQGLVHNTGIIHVVIIVMILLPTNDSYTYRCV